MQYNFYADVDRSRLLGPRPRHVVYPRGSGPHSSSVKDILIAILHNAL